MFLNTAIEQYQQIQFGDQTGYHIQNGQSIVSGCHESAFKALGNIINMTAIHEKHLPYDVYMALVPSVLHFIVHICVWKKELIAKRHTMQVLSIYKS